MKGAVSAQKNFKGPRVRQESCREEQKITISYTDKGKGSLICPQGKSMNSYKEQIKKDALVARPG